MYSIGIVGHSPEHFGADVDKVRRALCDTIDLLAHQYGKSDVVFNIMGEPGIGLWSAQKCIDEKYRYHLFLPNSLNSTLAKVETQWYPEQKNSLEMCYNLAWSLTIGLLDKGGDVRTFELLVEDSNFMTCFWIGKKQGKTFDAIKYAISSNKLSLNGLDGLRLITSQDTILKDNKCH